MRITSKMNRPNLLIGGLPVATLLLDGCIHDIEPVPVAQESSSGHHEHL